jgi:biotin operon repressor
MDQGYFKCWRKIINSQVFNNEGLLKVWIWCLAKASYKNRCVKFMTGKGGVDINIEPGQFVFGRDSASKELGMPPSTIWKRMEKLKNIGNLNIESNRQYSLILINNWHTYQEEKFKSNIESNYQGTGKEQARNTNKNSITLKKENNKTHTGDFISFWSAYPRKIGKDSAWKSWSRRNGDRPPLEEILTAIEKQKDSDQWKKDGGQFIPHPSTWINQGRWNDELTTSFKPSPNKEFWDKIE